MNISVIGAGHVGLVASACFADVGNMVLCMDVDSHKIDRLKESVIPIHEPALDAIVARNRQAGRLRFSRHYDEAVEHADIIFIAVGTPPNEDGSADLSHILATARKIGQHMTRGVLVVDKSTVPVGTADAVRETIARELRDRGLVLPFHVVSNPEFLKEGAAVNDFMRPDRIIVGSDDEQATSIIRQLYKPFNRNHDRLIEMDVRSAELSKYAANAMLATRISFMNELANLAEALGADIEAVRHGVGADPRIGPHFLYAGAGYGGSCLPKDVKALLRTAEVHGRPLPVLSAVQITNEVQKNVLYQKICRHFGGADKLQGATIALWGLSFKPNTDDLREAPSLILIRQLLAAQCRVRAYDPVATDEARRMLCMQYDDGVSEDALQFMASPSAAVQGADALVVITEWQEFRSPDFAELAASLRRKVIFDGRNLYDPPAVQAAGLEYHGIGRAGSKQ